MARPLPGARRTPPYRQTPPVQRSPEDRVAASKRARGHRAHCHCATPNPSISRAALPIGPRSSIETCTSASLGDAVPTATECGLEALTPSPDVAAAEGHPACVEAPTPLEDDLHASGGVYRSACHTEALLPLYYKAMGPLSAADDPAKDFDTMRAHRLLSGGGGSIISFLCFLRFGGEVFGETREGTTWRPGIYDLRAHERMGCVRPWYPNSSGVPHKYTPFPSKPLLRTRRHRSSRLLRRLFQRSALFIWERRLSSNQHQLNIFRQLLPAPQQRHLLFLQQQLPPVHKQQRIAPPATPSGRLRLSLSPLLRARPPAPSASGIYSFQAPLPFGPAQTTGTTTAHGPTTQASPQANSSFSSHPSEQRASFS
ncbi:hypothetical protein K438DRAFT_1992800 [Mycena galopus ATCC 62051]|nr:hypothetical protein K438DRAFT_1992800 [Mycena galopus ATCC 62051]